jgi:3-deoxy-manno-octulosonate cytidylyltransferase (CMP-KDO synthetase)
MMRGVVVLVPARFGAVRLPGKPLADIAGKPMIVRVLDGLTGCGAGILAAATDDARIVEAVEQAGHVAVMTGDAPSGTARVADAWIRLGRPGARIINIQGDEPCASSSWIQALTSIPAEDDLVVTIARRTEASAEPGPSSVKVVVDSRSEAMYFSRSPIPHGSAEYLEHVGAYCFSPASLEACIAAPPSEASRCEKLEQLAWMHSGIRIAVVEGDFEGTGVDTPGDLERIRRLFG